MNGDINHILNVYFLGNCFSPYLDLVLVVKAYCQLSMSIGSKLTLSYSLI